MQQKRNGRDEQENFREGESESEGERMLSVKFLVHAQLNVQKQNSWEYNFVEVSRHTLQTRFNPFFKSLIARMKLFRQLRPRIRPHLNVQLALT